MYIAKVLKSRKQSCCYFIYAHMYICYRNYKQVILEIKVLFFCYNSQWKMFKVIFTSETITDKN